MWKTLQARGIECVVAPREADHQLAYLCRTHNVQVVVANDSDYLVHGVPVMVTGYYSKGKIHNGKVYSRQAIQDKADELAEMSPDARHAHLLPLANKNQAKRIQQSIDLFLALHEQDYIHVLLCFLLLTGNDYCNVDQVGPVSALALIRGDVTRTHNTTHNATFTTYAPSPLS